MLDPIYNQSLRFFYVQFLFLLKAFYTGADLGEIVRMASTEIAPLSKHMTPKISAKKIMILPAFVCLWVTFNKSYKQIFMNYFI